MEKETRKLESSNTKLDNVLLQAERDHSSLIEEMKMREQTIAQTDQKLENLNRENEDLEEQTSKLEKECERAHNEYEDLCQNLESTVSKNKDVSIKLKSL